MAHFAQLDSNNVVIQVIVVRNEDCFDENGQESEAIGIAFINKHVKQANWIKTSYNTFGNLHYDSVTNLPDGGTPFRGNYAGIGFFYDKVNDVFYEPKPVDRNNIPCDSWSISASTNWLWMPPVPYPEISQPRKFYNWDEPTKTWVELTKSK